MRRKIALRVVSFRRVKSDRVTDARACDCGDDEDGRAPQMTTREVITVYQQTRRAFCIHLQSFVFNGYKRPPLRKGVLLRPEDKVTRNTRHKSNKSAAGPYY